MTVMYLPEDWDFSVRGIISIVPDGRDAVYSMLGKLIEFGYCTREAVRDGGKFVDYDYDFHEEPITVKPYTENPEMVTPNPEKPYTEKPIPGNPPQSSEDLKNVLKESEEEKNSSALLSQNTAENRREVFEYWQERTGHKKVFFNKEFQGLLRKLLTTGFTVDDLKRAVDGNKFSAFHCGDNENHTVYDSFDLIFRNAKKVAFFMGMYEKSLVPRHRARDTFAQITFGSAMHDDLETVEFKGISEIPRRPAPRLTEWEDGIYQNLRDKCQKHVNTDVFNTWFAPVICDGVDKEANTITLRCGPITIDWLRHHYSDLIAEILGDMKVIWIKESEFSNEVLSDEVEKMEAVAV